MDTISISSPTPPWTCFNRRQGLELCLSPMPLSHLVLHEGKAELGRLRRIYAFAGAQFGRFGKGDRIFFPSDESYRKFLLPDTGAVFETGRLNHSVAL